MDAYLVTGNLKHYPVRSYVVTPRQMLEIIEGDPDYLGRPFILLGGENGYRAPPQSPPKHRQRKSRFHDRAPTKMPQKIVVIS